MTLFSKRLSFLEIHPKYLKIKWSDAWNLLQSIHGGVDMVEIKQMWSNICNCQSQVTDDLGLLNILLFYPSICILENFHKIKYKKILYRS